MGTDVVVRATLASGEDGVVDARLDVLGIGVIPPEEDQPRPRTTQSLVRGSSNDIAVFEGVLQLLRRDQTGSMRDIGQQPCAVLVTDLLKRVVLPVTRVGASAAYDETRLEEAGLGSEGVVVDELGGRVQAVREGLEVDRRCGDLLLGGVVAVREMSAVGETETHDAVLGLDERGECREAAGGVSDC